MCHRKEILSAHDLIRKLPDEMSLDGEQLRAIVTVLVLLSSLLDGHRQD